MKNMTEKFFYLCNEGNVDGIRECLAHVDVDCIDKDGNSALHIAALKGFTECVRLLIVAGSNMDIKNLSGDTPLHVALSNEQLNVALLLIQSGANINSQDANGRSAVHIASKEGFTRIVHELCVTGCSLNLPDDQGYYPMHWAARNGHIEIIRYLCLFGSNVEQRNLKGVKAEVLAFKNGHDDVGKLLNKVRIKSYREAYINQLVPTNKLLSKYNVKFLGCPSTGKTTLIKSLKAGYFLSLFSKRQSQTNLFPGKTTRGSPTSVQIEMDFTSRRTSPNDFPQHEYTQGIEIHQASFGAGDVNLWDFSGVDTYYSVYDYFIGDSISYYVIVFDLSLTPDVQQNQCSIWLTFLQSRFHPLDILGVRVLLVGTHADLSGVAKDEQGVYKSAAVQEMKARLSCEFPAFIFDDEIVLCDAHLPSSQGIREIKNIIADKKAVLLQSDKLVDVPITLTGVVIVRTVGPDYHITQIDHINFQKIMKRTEFLDVTVRCLRTWRRKLEFFPVLSWSAFMDKVHREVNPLAGAQHIDQLITQLIAMAEIFYVKSKSKADDLVVLDVNWLCSDIIGMLLSLETITSVRMTGCYTEEDFQSCFPCGPADKMLDLLSALQICTQCENDGEIEFEFPCHNLIEKLDGLWAADDEIYSPLNGCYGGVRLKAPYKMLQTIFTRLQVQLRRATILCQDPNSDLYQWFEGSKLCLGDIEGFITLEEGGQVIEVKVRGTNSLRLNCFYFMEEILNIVNQVLFFMTPGLLLEKHILSSEELRIHAENPYAWSPDRIFYALMSSSGIQSTLRNPNINQDESVLQLIGFGCKSVIGSIIPGCDLLIGELPGSCLQTLAQLLDPPHPHGKDWCLLAVKLGLTQKIAALDNGLISSKTLALLDIWGKSAEATIGNLIKKLIGFGREDAANIVMVHAPLYKLLPTFDAEGVSPSAGKLQT